MGDKLLRVREFAERTRYNQVYVYELIRQGRINVIRIGGRSIRISEEELERFLSQSGKDKEGKDA